MTVQYYGLTILLIWLQLAAITAAVGPRFGSWALGRGCGILLLVMSGFFIEHFVGLGALNGVWVLSTVLAVFYLRRNWAQLCEGGFLRSEVVFILAFAYGLAWRICYPSIFPTSEHLTDLYFIGNYLGGATLPPLDHWYPPYHFDFYYALQHYGAALLGRIFHLSPGLTYNISFALLMALPVTLAWDIAGRFIATRMPKLLLVAALVCGGTGASVFTPLVFQPADNLPPQAMVDIANGRMWASARFIGKYDQLANTDFAKKWLDLPTREGTEIRELPLENFGYQYYVGDYHPPLGGFFLLLLAIGLICAIETRKEEDSQRRLLLQQGLMGLTVPATLAINTWVFPLQLALVGGWALWRQWHALKDSTRAPSWRALMIGGAAGFALLYPFLTGFASRTLETPIKLVQLHTPLSSFLILLWPLLLLIGLGLFNRDTRRVSLYFALVFGGLLLFSEFFFVDDPSINQFQRTNSVMKWWGWIWTGGLVALGAPLLAAKQRWMRAVTALALVGTLFYAVYTVNYLRVIPMPMAGKLNADGFYTQQPAVRDMFRYLTNAPRGIVMENLYSEAYNEGGVYATFAAQPLLLGWPAHIVTWHGKVEEAMQRRNKIRYFYSGYLLNPLDWLEENNVSYIVWNARDAMVPDVWQRWKNALEPGYAWHTFGYVNGQQVGLWVRRKK